MTPPPAELEQAILDLLARRAPGMAARGALEWTQSGSVVDPATVRGAVRLRLPAA